jgi:hypothetical protein
MIEALVNLADLSKGPLRRGGTVRARWRSRSHRRAGVSFGVCLAASARSSGHAVRSKGRWRPSQRHRTHHACRDAVGERRDTDALPYIESASSARPTPSSAVDAHLRAAAGATDRPDALQAPLRGTALARRSAGRAAQPISAALYGRGAVRSRRIRSSGSRRARARRDPPYATAGCVSLIWGGLSRPRHCNLLPEVIERHDAHASRSSLFLRPRRRQRGAAPLRRSFDRFVDVHQKPSSRPRRIREDGVAVPTSAVT